VSSCEMLCELKSGVELGCEEDDYSVGCDCLGEMEAIGERNLVEV
jgi:hypothetical protein